MDVLSHLLDLADENSSITESYVEGNVKHITVQNNLFDHFCPVCGSKLYSKGSHIRRPEHQILQDGFTLDLTLKGRRWMCSNPNYRHQEVDIFAFQILQELKDINLTAVQVARRFHISDTYVHKVFMQHVNLPRLPLSEFIAIDEVFFNLSPDCIDALIIMDFLIGNIIDILPGKRKFYTQEYFYSIPLTERKSVKYLICDMYSPYINFISTYFPNAIAVTD